MDFNNIKSVHIIGIGGCACSGLAEFLNNKKFIVSGSEQKIRKDLDYLINSHIKISFNHDKNNLLLNSSYPSIVLYSPAVASLNPNNPELLEAKNKNIPLMSWQTFLGEYLKSIGSIGILASGSEGKGTTCGILSSILIGTYLDPLSIFGAKLKDKRINNPTNLYIGNGKSYILEGDEYNKNFQNYHPEINITINFQYEHPETYKDFNDYKEAFYEYFLGMVGRKLLIFRATDSLIQFTKDYNLKSSHEIVFFGDENMLKKVDKSYEKYLIKDMNTDLNGSQWKIVGENLNEDFFINSLPAYLIQNGTGAIISSTKLGIPINTIKDNLKNFLGMIRRFSIYKTKNGGVIITDYGHSPESLNHIIEEIRTLFPNKRLHIIFQPHLFSRTYNFFDEFIYALSKADKTTLIEVYPARENRQDWIEKVSSYKIYEKLKNLGKISYYGGEAKDIINIYDKIDENDINCFIGAGDMDFYYQELFDKFETKDFVSIPHPPFQN